MSAFDNYYAQLRKEQEERKRNLLMKLTDGEVLAWADRMDAEGYELKMTWDGGGDSGWVDFECDKPELTDEDSAMIEILRDLCYEELDYGSWAGEFSASGEAIYNAYTKCFEGMDYYSEDDSISQDCDIKVTVPEDLWFNRLDIMIEDEEANVTVDFVVNNGFYLPEHETQQKEVSEQVEKQVQLVIKDVIQVGYEYRGMWEEIQLNASDFVSNGDGTKTATVTSIQVGIYNSDDKEICINLNPNSEEE